MKQKFWKIFLSIILIAYGFQIIYNPRFYDTKYGMFHDFTAIKWPLGGFLIITGLLVFAFAFYKKNKTESRGKIRDIGDRVD